MSDDYLLIQNTPNNGDNHFWIISDGIKSNVMVRGFADKMFSDTQILDSQKHNTQNLPEEDKTFSLDQFLSKETGDICTANTNAVKANLEIEDGNMISKLESPSYKHSIISPTPAVFFIDKFDENGKNCGRWEVIGFTSQNVDKSMEFTILSSNKIDFTNINKVGRDPGQGEKSIEIV